MSNKKIRSLCALTLFIDTNKAKKKKKKKERNSKRMNVATTCPYTLMSNPKTEKTLIGEDGLQEKMMHKC